MVALGTALGSRTAGAVSNQGGACKEKDPPWPDCGDGIVVAPEECDDGVNDGSFGGCTLGCRRGPYCGDGVVQKPYEECDDIENSGAYGTCGVACKLGAYCSDGVVQLPDEDCDDGGNEELDGCSETCLIELYPSP
jgi:cysteine-rich repeat protein